MSEPNLSTDRLGELLSSVRALYPFARTASSSAFRRLLLDTLHRSIGHTHVAVNCAHESGHISSFSRGFAGYWCE